MAIKALILKLSKPVPLLLVASILVISLCFLVANSLLSDISGKAQYWIIVANIVGIILLLLLVLINVVILYRQYRNQILGSKLSLRLVGMFVLLNFIPLLLVYYFAVQFLNKGVDSWFDVRVEQAISDALLLGQNSLEIVKQDMLKEVEEHSKNVAEIYEPWEMVRFLNDVRERYKYSEISLLTPNGRIIASDTDDNSLIPDMPDASALTQVQLGQSYSSVEPISSGTQQLRVISPVYSKNIGLPIRAIQAVKPLPLRYANLARNVESAKSQYDQMVFSRAPLRLSLILTLSLISLATLLLSCLAAFYVSRRIVAPLGTLASGTKEVAAGNYDMQLPIHSNDELGILVGSFNDMTQQINYAQGVASRSQKETEAQREYLQAVLSNLSSGVISIDDQQTLATTNSTAEKILNCVLSEHIGENLSSLAAKNENLAPFFEAIQMASNKNMQSWQDERTVLGSKGRQILIIRGSSLPHHANSSVIVFDDVTNLIQAQKDAAWGEVARRLAHEIKNPLTPIRLSAERILHKFARQVEPDTLPILEKSTRTIVQQVDAMKEMVDAFSSYAQSVRTEKTEVNLNQLLSDVLELHQHSSQTCNFELQLDNDLPIINSNSNALRQVFANLVINALHAMETVEKPQLLISTQLTNNLAGEYVDIEVTDNGTGIPKELQDSLFEPYVSSKAKGSGLGLAIVKRIVEELGGSVWAENIEPKGSKLIVRLPVTPTTEQLHKSNPVL
ncbi:MAG: sensor histidine kinase [Arenicella sp.]